MKHNTSDPCTTQHSVFSLTAVASEPIHCLWHTYQIQSCKVELFSFILNSTKVWISSAPLNKCFGWEKKLANNSGGKKYCITKSISECAVTCVQVWNAACYLFVFNASLKSQGLCFTTDCIKAKKSTVWKQNSNQKNCTNKWKNINFNCLKSAQEESRLWKQFHV